jgi:type IV pilus assembly protein PilM
MRGKNKRKAVLGLDIGSSAVKLVALEPVQEGVRLAAFAIAPVPRDAIVNGAIVNPAAAMEAIQQAVERGRMKPGKVAIAVSGNSVIVKRVPVPVMADEEVSGWVRSQAGQHIPFELSDVNLSYQVLDGEPGAQREVVLAAAKKDTVAAHTGLVRQAGYAAAVVDIGAFALGNCYELNYEPAAGQTVALLNVGASLTNISVVRGEQPRFTRDVPLGGNHFTEALAKQFDLSYDDAERLKQGEDLADYTAEQGQAALRPVTEMLVLETRKTFDFFRAPAGAESIERIWISGGTARLPGLKAMLEEEFGMPVEELDPFRKVSIPADGLDGDQIRRFGSQFAIAVGLALRSFDPA